MPAQYQAGAVTYALANGEVWISDPAGGNRKLLSSGLNGGFPKLRNGLVYFVSYQFPYKLYRVNPLDAVPTPVPVTTVDLAGAGVLEFDIDPSGTRIVLTYIESPAGSTLNFKLYVQDLANAATRTVLVDSPGIHNAYPYWAPDGFIYFGQANFGNAFSQHILRVPANGGPVTSLTSPFSQYVAYVPVANRLAFVNTTSYTLSLMQPDGTGQAAVPGGHNGVTNGMDASSDGTTLFYFVGGTLFRVPVAGGPPTAIHTGASGGTGISFGLVAPPVPADAYQVRYISHLQLGDSVINLTNTGARGAGLAAGTTASTTGAICANVYAFSPDEQMVACCSCPVTPNGLVSLSARQDLVSNTLTPAVPTSLVVKLVASVPDATAGCADSAVRLTAGTLAPGLAAWGTTMKAGLNGRPAEIVETRFLPATLSTAAGPGANVGELARLTQLCNFINANGSGFGVCRSCRLGGLGGGRS